MPQREYHITDIKEIEGHASELVGQANLHGYSEGVQFALRLVIEEALTNALRHGHRDLPDNTPVRFTWSVDETSIQLDVEDKGPGFNPDDLPDPTLDENLEKPSGRGVMLMRAYMTEVKYNETGNQVTMTYTKSASISD
ncbi:MAG: ATP-binding protein [Phycisphaerales bacterium JB043]